MKLYCFDPTKGLPAYTLVYSTVGYLPDTANSQAHIERLAWSHDLDADVMTDQVDLRRKNGRKVATYMAGA